MFQKLIAIARKCQHGQLTERQYTLLERAVLATQPYGSRLMLGWYWIHRRLLRRALDIEEITVRHPKPSPLHRFKLTQPGLARLSELEPKTQQMTG